MLLSGITIPDALEWVNEFEYNQVEQTVDRSISGAAIIQEAATTFGREINLVGGPDGAWVTKSVVDSIRALEATPDNVLVLNYHDGRNFNVVFNRSGGSAIEARQVTRYGLSGPDKLYTLTIRLLTVQ